MSSSTVVLITGANSGIGFATAQVLVQASSHFHVIIARRNLDNALSAKLHIEESGDIKGSLSTVQLEVTDEHSIEHAAVAIEKQFGRLDALINNAGIAGHAPSPRTSFEATLAVNVLGPAMVSEAFRLLLFKSAKPYSLYISTGQRSLFRNATQSVSTHSGGECISAYLVSKAALNMLGLQEVKIYGRQGLMTFVVSPGFVRSNARGTSEEQRSGWGKAGDPKDSGRLMLDILQGNRDRDVGCFVHKDGVWDW